MQVHLLFSRAAARCSLEIIKQLFDIGCLFDSVNNFTGVLASFRNVSAIELGYRKMEGQMDGTTKTSAKVPCA